MTDTATRIEALSAGIATLLKAIPGPPGANLASMILTVGSKMTEAEWLDIAEARLAGALSTLAELRP